MGEGDGDVGEDDRGVGVDRGDDDGLSGVPAPPGKRGREPPFFFFFLDLLTRWEEGFRSFLWPPWRRRGGSPSEIGSPSLFSYVSRSPDQAKNRFLYSRRSVTPIALRF